ncbi:salicylate hydroxylase [Xylogone sp. PMI_703]|nr:salicylate hydroxylase [Xylogone sp. PMI_703]
MGLASLSIEFKDEPLNITIVGGGIAGVTAAIACRRAGHNVTIYERSSLNNEFGAAISMGPNASRSLLAWGFDPVRARAIEGKRSYRAYGPTLESFHIMEHGNITETYGSPYLFIHRVDFHDELRRLATENKGKGQPATIHLKSPVTRYAPRTGSIELTEGAIITGDLVIAADGVHSIAVETILGAPNPAYPTGQIAYRFLIPTSKLLEDPLTAQLVDNEGTMKFFIDPGDFSRRLVWYPCRNHEIQNFALFQHSNEEIGSEDWQTSASREALLDMYSDFHPAILAIIDKATNIKKWPLLFRAPVQTWHKRKLLAVGDAAHPMLPHQGQGASQALEDAVALGIVLSGATNDTLEHRLQIFEKIRMKRASIIQIFSNAGQEQADRIHGDAAKYINTEDIPKSPDEFIKYNFGYDVVADAVKMMQDECPNWKLPTDFFW